MDVLWLTEKEVKSLLSMDDAIPAVEKAFLDHGLGRTQMPPKPYLYFPKYDGDLRTMPAYLEGLGLAGVKIVNVHPRNHEKGLPTVMALLVLNSPETGAPISVMGATHLTSMRTGAAGAVAAKYLARPESDTVGFVGAGAQARTQLMGLVRFFEIKKVIVFDRRTEGGLSFERDSRAFLPPDCEFRATTDPKEACDCDILVTTTPVRTPIVESAWVKPGTHINAIGADAKGKQELESTLTRKAKIVVDDMAQAVHSGEVNVPISEGSLRPEEIYAQIGEIVSGAKKGRANREEITIFDSTGLGIQDVAAGSAVFKKALAAGIGTSMGFL
jgi:alanine dehydrogenase